MNSVNLVGRLCADPELRRTNDGTAVCSYSLAVKRPMVKDATDFIECVSWKQGAEYLAQYGHKGDIVAVSGPLTSRKWKDKNDNNRINWEIQAETVELLSSKKNTEGNNNTTQNQNSFQGQVYQPQQSYQQPQYNQQGFGSYQPQGFGGYAPIENDDPKLPF